MMMFAEGFSAGKSLISPTIKRKISEIWEDNEFKGDANEIFLAPKRFLGTQTLVLVGLGKKEKFTHVTYRQAVGSVTKFLQGKKFYDCSIIVPQEAWDHFEFDSIISHTIIGAHTASYQFNHYVTQKDSKIQPVSRIFFGSINGAKSKNGDKLIREGEIIAFSINFTRHLGNLPPIDMTPEYMGNEAITLGRKHKQLNVRVMGVEEIRKEKLGGLLAVSLGSYQEPRFIVMEYFGNPDSKDTYVFVGKAITFDAGGISIKPSEKMDEMKFDMLGGGAVMGAIKAIVELKMKVNIVGLVPASENLPGHRAYRPGDIIKARNGKTIEVLNTDAEGRIILADALSYAQDYKPKAVIDLATLTGAVVGALGERYAGIFSRDEEFIESIQAASKSAGELTWRLPLDDEFKEMMKSKIADTQNISGSRYGGASTGAAFLEYFTNYTWAHLDIAGVAWGGENAYRYQGATGYGVQLLVELAKKWAE